MKIVLFGATGTLGQRIAQEARDRGYAVTAVVRDPSRATGAGDNLTFAQGNVGDPASVAQVAAGHDAVISAIGPGHDQDLAVLSTAAQSLLTGLAQTDLRRLIVVNGAGSLEVAPGVQLVDSPSFPAAWRPVALAHRDALDVLRGAETDLEWTAASPAAFIAPGERTGHYRTGTDQLLTNANGESAISAEDFAVAVLDELENGQFIRQRFTAAY